MSYHTYLTLIAVALCGCNAYESGTADAGFAGVEPVLTEQERTRASVVAPGRRKDRIVWDEERIRKWNEDTERVWSQGREDFIPAEPPTLPGSKPFDRRSTTKGLGVASTKECSTQLVNARQNLQKYQTLFNHGNVEKGYHGITESRNKRTRIVRDPRTGTAHEVRESPNLGDAKADELVSCKVAMKRSSKYRQSARKCREYQDKIRESEMDVRDAQRCISAARGR